MGAEPNLYDFLDYRQFLKGYYHHRKSSNRSYSYLMLSRSAGKKSANFIKLIMENKRALSQKNISKVAQACKLDEKETQYFTILVQWNQSREPTTRKVLWEHLRRLIPKDKYYILHEYEKKIISRWYFLALLEIIYLSDFEPNAEWISKRFKNKIAPEEAEETLQLLIDMGLLKDENGKLIRTQKVLYSGGNIPSEIIQNYHKQNIPIGIDSISDVDVTRRHLTAISMSVRDKDIPKLKKKIEEFQDEILDYVQTIESADDVYQLNIQFFPLTKKMKLKKVA